jgi:hypothetical protein
MNHCPKFMIYLAYVLTRGARYIDTFIVKYDGLPTNFFIVTTSEPKALASGYLSSSTPYQKFLEGPSKSFFKSFFLGTKLG